MLIWESTTQEQLVALIGDALSQFGSLLSLSQSPLATPELIRRALILDWSTPTADERGLALQLILRWSVAQLAPTPLQSGEAVRPFDDPTWINPLWWQYNILYHSYVAPLHPDQFMPGCKRVDTLIALTGIANHDAFYDERKRALRSIAELLLWLTQTNEADQTIQDMMVEMLLTPLSVPARQLLNEAAIFRDTFQQSWLVEITTLSTQKYKTERDYLLKKRLMFAGDDGARFIVPAAIRQYLTERYLSPAIQQRHIQIGRLYESENAHIIAAWHYQQGNNMNGAAQIVIDEAETLLDTSSISQLCDLLQKFHRADVSADYWRQIQTLLGRALYLMGDSQGAVTATRHALKVTADPIEKAILFHRLGKLHEDHLPDFALTYYSRAAEHLPVDHPQRCDLLKDRAWLHLYHKAWEAAKNDLQQAQTLASTPNKRASINDVYAVLYHERKRYDLALQYAHQALIDREEGGDVLAIAKSYNTIGNIYFEMNFPSKAAAAYNQACAMLKQSSNQELHAKTLSNIGATFYLMEEYEQALIHYKESLTLLIAQQMSRQIGIGYYNITEALIKLERFDEAHTYWEKGVNYCTQYNFQSVLNMLEQLKQLLPTRPAPSKEIPYHLKPAHKLALELVEAHSYVTRKQLIAESEQDVRFKKGLTTNTAKRRLTDLVKMGLLKKHGKGAGTHYRHGLSMTIRDKPHDDN